MPAPLDNLAKAKAVLSKALLSEGKSKQYIQSQLSMLFDDAAFLSRFKYINKHVKIPSSPRVLISGAAVGGEIVGALTYNPQSIVATEISEFYLEACAVRFQEHQQIINYMKVDSSKLEMESELFDLCVSGHIIEHTPDPHLYLSELFRVLKPGGFLFLEFPTRFGTRELHTNTLSFEWLPYGLRNECLKFMERRSRVESTRLAYASVRNELMPVSVIDCLTWLKKAGYAFRIIGLTMPARGIVRVIFRKI